MTHEEMITLVGLLSKAGAEGIFDNDNFIAITKQVLDKNPVSSPSAFLGFYIGWLCGTLSREGVDIFKALNDFRDAHGKWNCKNNNSTTSKWCFDQITLV